MTPIHFKLIGVAFATCALVFSVLGNSKRAEAAETPADSKAPLPSKKKLEKKAPKPKPEEEPAEEPEEEPEEEKAE